MLRRFVLIRRGNRLSDILAHFGHVNGRRPGKNTVLGSAAGLVSHFGRFQQCLAWHTASPGAITANAMLFYQGDACAQPGGKVGCHQPGRTSTDNDQVVKGFLDHPKGFPFSRHTGLIVVRNNMCDDIRQRGRIIHDMTWWQ